MVLPGLAVSEGASRVVIADGAAPLTANGVCWALSMTDPVPRKVGKRYLHHHSRYP